MISFFSSLTKINPMNVIEKEKIVIEFMIKHYCKKIHGGESLCKGCTGLTDYAKKKLDACRYGEKKMSCKKCPTHCYNLEQREEIRKIMRYVGPRMIFLQPIEMLRHRRIVK